MGFLSKFVQTFNKQLVDGASPIAVVYAGLLRFLKTVSANFHLVPINREFMYGNLSNPSIINNWKMVLIKEQLIL